MVLFSLWILRLDVTELAKYPYISYFGSYVCLVKSFKEFFLTYELECLYTGDERYDIQKKRTEYYMVKVDTQKDVEENTVGGL